MKRYVSPLYSVWIEADIRKVSWKHSEAWAEKLQTLQPDVPIHLSWPTGYHVLDKGQKIYHVFDRDHNMETSWLKEPLEFVQKYWPALAIQ